MFKAFTIPKRKTRIRTPVDAEGVRARHLVYRLFEDTSGQPGAWQALRTIGDRPETVAKAVERGWLVVRDDVVGKVKVRSGMLTDEGRRVARRGFRG